MSAPEFKAFWIVCKLDNENALLNTKKHLLKSKALLEAVHLAETHIGTIFIVMESCEAYVAKAELTVLQPKKLEVKENESE